MSIYVTKPFIPPGNKFLDRVNKVISRGILTNQGPEVEELQQGIKEYLKVSNFHYVTNGTIALQLALKALDITEGEVITTPFSYVATTSSILWERCEPVFVDIEPENFTIDITKIESAITEKTKAIMPVHVFGYACDVDQIKNIAKKYNLKVIYDGAHAFGSYYKSKSLCSYGDITTLSFHATKLFHTLEGGGIVTNETSVSERLELLKKFGHIGDEHFILGINGKQDEINAAMGNVNLHYLPEIISRRKKICDMYDNYLTGLVKRPKRQKDLEYNYAYYPVLFKSESELMRVFKKLNQSDIFPRRYFYPSLNSLPYLNNHIKCEVSEDISSRISCLPLYYDLTDDEVLRIAEIISGEI